LYGHLLDGDLASNHLSWQWVAGTGSHKPYLFNAENVARYAPAVWHSAGSVIDTSYEALNQIARQVTPVSSSPLMNSQIEKPALLSLPPRSLNIKKPDAKATKGRDVWLVHPWNLGDLPTELPKDTLVIGIYSSEFHDAWPWNEKRWLFVHTRMAELASECWFGEASTIKAALHNATSVKGFNEQHIAPLLQSLGLQSHSLTLFPEVARRCDSFSKWWHIVSRL
jgi:deoxyribodipyrimidine photo-lyase